MEQRIMDAGGCAIYVETASKTQYASTRAFYERCGYTVTATLPDFYSPGDDKVIYSKPIKPSPSVPIQSSGD
jgi:hypothetical protein